MRSGLGVWVEVGEGLSADARSIMGSGLRPDTLRTSGGIAWQEVRGVVESEGGITLFSKNICSLSNVISFYRPRCWALGAIALLRISSTSFSKTSAVDKGHTLHSSW